MGISVKSDEVQMVHLESWDIEPSDDKTELLLDTKYAKLVTTNTERLDKTKVWTVLKTFLALLLVIFAFIVSLYLVEWKDYNAKYKITGDDPCRQFEFVSRAEWRARPPKQRTTIPPTNMTFIHHSAEAECSDKMKCEDLIRAIQNLHMDVRGWDDIGYNFLVGGDGRVYEGRGWQVQGAHAPMYNSISHGICILGNYMDHMQTPAATKAAKAIMQCGVNKGHIQENYELFGHRDGRCTDCPGDILYRDLQSWPHYSHRKIPIYCPTSSK